MVFIVIHTLINQPIAAFTNYNDAVAYARLLVVENTSYGRVTGVPLNVITLPFPKEHWPD